jgi:hypothetical protein
MIVFVGNRRVFVKTGARTSQTINICTANNVHGGYEYVFRLPLERRVSEAEVSAHQTISDLSNWLVERGATREKPRESRGSELNESPPLAGAVGNMHAAEPSAPGVAVTAIAVAGMVAGPVTRFDPGKLLPGNSAWFRAGGQRLVVVVDQDASQLATDKAFAYALAWQHDDDLTLVLPKQRAPAVLYRLPWIATSVDVWTTETGGRPEPAVIPAREEILAVAGRWPLRRRADHDLGDLGAWVAALTDAAANNPALVPAHRAAYQAWHCAGRKVLQLQRIGGTVQLIAGVQYRKPTAGQQYPHSEQVTQALSPRQTAHIAQVMEKAIADRLGGIDKANLENRMQANLARAHMPGLDLVGPASREYPVWRPMECPGSIDFLGIDRHQQLHVVETKVGSDGTLVLQALDYLIWVTAHAVAIRTEHGWPVPSTDCPVHLDLVLASKGNDPGLGPYTAGQLEALAGDVAWRVFLVTDANAPIPEVVPLPRSAIHHPKTGLVARPMRPPRSAMRPDPT